MSDDDPDAEYHKDAQDRRLLSPRVVATSRAHDAVVLENARATGEQIAGRAKVHPKRKVRRFRSLLPIGVPVAAVLLAATVLLLIPQTPPTDRYRGVPQGEVTPEHATTLARAPTQMSWPATKNARYHLEIRIAEGEIFWESDALVDNRLLVGEATGMPGFTPGATYLWSVRVAHESGESSLGPYWFTIESIED